MPKRLFHSYQPTTTVHAHGEDAFSFLQSQSTQDLRLASANRAVYSLWLNHKGKVVGDGFVFRENEESLWLISPFTPEQTLIAHWQKHIIADEVELETPACPWRGIACNAAAMEALTESGFESELIQTAPGRRAHDAWAELFFADEESAESVRQKLLDCGAEELDENAMEQQRIAAGLARVPIDCGAEDLPAEAGLVEPAVSFTKGCFLGQEVVARLHHVGRPRRGLFRLRGDGAVPKTGAPIMAADNETIVGELRSAVQIDNNHWLGLALCNFRKMENVTEFLIHGQRVNTIDTSPPQ